MQLKLASVVLLMMISGCAHTPPAQHPTNYPGAVAVEPPYWDYPEGDSWRKECVGQDLPQQSPIDLVKADAKPWDKSYVVAQSTLDAHDRNVVFMPTPGPSVSFNPVVGNESVQTAYTVAGFHFHNRAEHRIAGNPLIEMHIKTTDSFGGTAVFAVLWTDGATDSDPTLEAAVNSLSTQRGEPKAVDVGRLLQKFAQEPFYSYVGSLTTPPCTGNIRFFVLKNPIRTNASLINNGLIAGLVAKGVSRDNFRPLKPVLSTTTVYLVTPKNPRP